MSECNFDPLLLGLPHFSACPMQKGVDSYGRQSDRSVTPAWHGWPVFRETVAWKFQTDQSKRTNGNASNLIWCWQKKFAIIIICPQLDDILRLLVGFHMPWGAFKTGRETVFWTGSVPITRVTPHLSIPCVVGSGRQSALLGPTQTTASKAFSDHSTVLPGKISCTKSICSL